MPKFYAYLKEVQDNYGSLMKRIKRVYLAEKENLEEERRFIEELNLPETYFWSLHPLDSVRIDGILGEDKEEMIKTLDHAVKNAKHANINRVSRVGML